MTEQLNRHRERGSADRADLDAILDDVLAGTLSTVVDGAPWVVPMLFARDGDRILLHGSTGAGALRHVASGAPAALSVMAVDGLVVAHSTFASSANYRSAVVHGTLTPLRGRDREQALERLSERLIPGRPAEVVRTTSQELAATLAMELAITDGRWLVKRRTGDPGTPEGRTDAWCGVVPLRVVAGDPAPAPWSREVPVPDSVRRFVQCRGGG